MREREEGSRERGVEGGRERERERERGDEGGRERGGRGKEGGMEREREGGRVRVRERERENKVWVDLIGADTRGLTVSQCLNLCQCWCD